MHTMERRDILRLLLTTFLIGFIILVVAKFSPDFAYDIENNLYSNRYYYPIAR